MYVPVDLYLYNTITITVLYRPLLSRIPTDVKAFFNILPTYAITGIYTYYCTFFDHADILTSNFCESLLFVEFLMSSFYRADIYTLIASFCDKRHDEIEVILNSYI